LADRWCPSGVSAKAPPPFAKEGQPVRFEVKHTIEGTVDEVERAMLDPSYGAFLLQHHGVLLEVQGLERREAGDKIHRKVRYRPKPVIEAIGPKKVPPEWFAFVETSTYDKKKRELSFENVPTSSKISNLLTNSGTIRLKASGNRTERQTEGEIKLHLPFFMKPLAVIAERVIHAEGLKLLDGEVPVLNRFVAETLRKSA
jgi:hypothetical protein